MADLSNIPTEELMRMRGAPAGGSGVDLSQMSTEDLLKMRGSDAPEKKSLLRKSLEITTAPLEAGLALASGATTGLLGRVGGTLGGILGSVATGKFGTQEGANLAARSAEEGAAKLTYQPRGEVAQEGMRNLGQMLEASKLAGLGPNEAMMLGNITNVSDSISALKGRVQEAPRTLRAMVTPAEPAMSGVGAAETSKEAMRRTRAADLPVPVKLSKGEATRDFEQQRFERETAKEGSRAGALLREHGAEENKNVIKNMEWFMDDTGAAAPSARVTGSVVDDALRSRSDLMKAKYRDAYKQAEKAGEMAELVDTTPLLNFINENASASTLAPVLSAAEKEIVRLGGATRTKDGVLFPGKMSLNDIEKTRKMIVGLSKADETNGRYGAMANTVIDQMTEGAGGNLYKEARTLFKDHAAEFKNQGAIKKLLATKPGTTDRAVAFEDVFRHSVLGGSMDDTSAIFRSLNQAGPKGAQAVAELKGATIKYLQDEASKNAARDINGNPILSYSKLNNAVRELEIDGKLDLLFGKKGAQQIRDIAEIVADLNVAPPGAVNTSTTSSVLMEALGAAVTGRLPTATARTIEGVKNAVGDFKKLRRVKEALALTDEAAAGPAPKPPRGSSIH